MFGVASGENKSKKLVGLPLRIKKIFQAHPKTTLETFLRDSDCAVVFFLLTLANSPIKITSALKLGQSELMEFHEYAR